MAGLLIEGQAGEIATLKSRGGSGTQLLGVFLTQGVLLGLLAAVAGAFLAAALALALVQTFVPSSAASAGAPLSAAYLAPLASPGSVVGPALLGALLGVGAITLAAVQTARMDVLAFRREQGRQAQPPFWARYYLDLIGVALCVVGYLELGQFGSTSVRAQLPGGASSPLLLVAPALLLLAGALVTLRLAPLAAGVGERLAARGRGFSAMLAFAQVERTPAKYLRMTLLLTLAVGLGIFAISYNASLTRNVQDSASYTVGASLRLTQHIAEGQGFATKVEKAYQTQPGVRVIAPVYRTVASTTADQGSFSLGVLVVDPTTFTQVVNPVSWRSDYASASLPQLMQDLTTNATSSQAGAPVWAIVSQNFAQQNALKVDDKFALTLNENSFGSNNFVVGAVVADFPTLYPNQYPAGFMVVGQAAFDQAVKVGNPNAGVVLGPNEFWVLNDGNAAHEAAMTNYVRNHPELDTQTTLSLRETLATAQANPVSAGMRGLLLIGAIMAALLAVLGAIIQSALAARQRATQFAVLRTLGVGTRELIQILLSEQSVVYVFGLVGGTALGALLVSATLPFLQFSDRPVDPALLGTPPYVLVTDPTALGIFYLALLLAFVVALLIAARYAATVGLGRALRLGED
jgi:putative ABC transport system permease protein